MALVVLAEKRNFRFPIRLSESAVVVPWNLYRDNALRNPPSVSLGSWCNESSQRIGDFDLRFASQSLFLELLKELHVEHGFTGEYWQSCPTLADLYQKVRKKRYPLMSHQARHRESLENRLSGILHHAGDVFACNRGIDLKKLLDHDFILELDGTIPEIKRLILSLLLSRILLYRIATGERTPHLRTLVIVDEGQNLFRRQEELSDSPSTLGHLITLAREFGCGIVVGVQNIRDVSYALTSNCAHKIGTGFSDMRDLDEFCRIIA